MRLEILATALLYFGGPFLTGYTLRHLLKLKNEGFLFSIVSGTMLWWAVMELILVPMTMMLASFSHFVILYTVVVLILTAAGLFFWKDIVEDGKYLIKNIKKYLTFGHLIALLLICYQLYFIHHHMYLEWDDTYYVNLANEAVYSDQIYWIYPETGAFPDFDKRYVLSLWPIFYAWLSKLIGVMPTIMAHTILPWLIIPLAYMVYGLIGSRLFPEDHETQGIFLAMAVLLHLFMSGQHTSGLTFLSITPWVGKGVLAAVLIPMLFYMVFKSLRDRKACNWVLLGITGLGGCLLSSMAIMLTPVFIGVSVFLYAICHKKPVDIIYGVASCIPCLILGIYYIYLIS